MIKLFWMKYEQILKLLMTVRLCFCPAEIYLADRLDDDAISEENLLKEVVTHP